MKKPLVYPFTFEQWKAHPSTKIKLKMIKELAKEIKYGVQLKISL